MTRVQILGIGHYVPEGVLTNFDLEKIVETSDEWIRERTGIRERRIAAPDQAASDLAYEAAKVALDRAGLSPRDLDLIIVATATPDMAFPSTACLLQDRLGAPKVPCFDLQAACPGFLYALEVGKSMLLGSTYETALVVGAECLSKITDWTDRSTCVLFGDGAGAAVLGKGEGDRGILSVYLGGDGSLAELLYLPAGGSRLPASEETVRNRLHYLKMRGREVFKYAVLGMQESAQRALEMAGIEPEALRWVVPHQANTRIIEATRQKLKLPPEKVYVNIDRYGNTSAASIPIALSELVERGELQAGDLVLLVAFGAGFTWGGAVVRW